jgi:glycosyltransferase involved in cell wall biosynthesis
LEILSCPDKIAIIDHVGSKAGIDYYSLELLQGLQFLDCEGYYYSNELSAGYDEIQKVKVFEKFTPNGALAKIKDYFKGYLCAFKACKKEGINKVILHSFAFGPKELYSILMAKLFRLQITLIVHDISTLAGKDNVWMRTMILNRSTHLVVHNHFSYIELKKLLSNFNKKKLVIIEHGNFINLINPNVTKENAREKLGLNPKINYLLFFGQIKKIKDLETLLKAMPLVDENTHLIIAGKTWQTSFDEYDDLIARLRIKDRIIKEIRHIEDAEREVYFKACDAIVLPYKKIYQSGVLLMSMSYGLPAIVSSLEPFEEIIKKGKNGLIFDPHTEKELAFQINQLFTNSEQYEMISRMSYHTVQTKYSWIEIAKKYCLLLKK